VMFISLSAFFFQAEDGIRDRNVTGVQTCALPISRRFLCFLALILVLMVPISAHAQQWSGIIAPSRAANWSTAGVVGDIPSGSWEIGRASCRERGESWEGGVRVSERCRKQ